MENKDKGKLLGKRKENNLNLQIQQMSLFQAQTLINPPTLVALVVASAASARAAPCAAAPPGPSPSYSGKFGGKIQ